MDDTKTRARKDLSATLLCLTLFISFPAFTNANETSGSGTITGFADNSTHLAESSTTTDTSSTSEEEGEDVVGYVEGCAGGIALGSIVPGIGTIIGGVVGCGLAWFW